MQSKFSIILLWLFLTVVMGVLGIMGQFYVSAQNNSYSFIYLNENMSFDLQVFSSKEDTYAELNEEVYFFANYTVNNSYITDALCNISFIDGIWNMSMNDEGLYVFHRHFLDPGAKFYYVTCGKKGYLTLTTKPDPNKELGDYVYVYSMYTIVKPLNVSDLNRLILPNELVYEGSFRLPWDRNSDISWSYGGYFLTYYPKGDPNGSIDGYPGSLFSTSHNMVSEFSIPDPVIPSNKDYRSLPFAKTLQPFSDITDGLRNVVGVDKLGGIAYFPKKGNQTTDKLYWTIYEYYNAAGIDYLSHGCSEVNLSDPNAKGVWHLGKKGEIHSMKTAGYIFDIPEEWADKYVHGRYLVSGRTRENGAFGGTQGPALFAYFPYNYYNNGTAPPYGAELNTTPLLYYPFLYGCSNQGTCYYPDYKACDHWYGGGWVTIGNKSAVILVGVKSLGRQHYGFPREGDSSPYKGFHCDPYEAQFIFYDPQELAMVAKGLKKPWEVVPYAIYRPGKYIYSNKKLLITTSTPPSGAAFDRERGIFYIIQANSDRVTNKWEPRPVVHVFTFNVSLNISFYNVELPYAIVGIFYNFKLPIYGGIPPYNWSIVEGNLPLGFVLRKYEGIIEGITNETGKYVFKVRVTDSTGSFVEKKFTLKVYDSKLNNDFDVTEYIHNITIGPENISIIKDIFNNISPNTVIFFKDGVYILNDITLPIVSSNVSIVSLSKNTNNVILNGNWSTNVIFNVTGDNVFLGYLTIKNVLESGVILEKNARGIVLSHLILENAGTSFIKVVGENKSLSSCFNLTYLSEGCINRVLVDSLLRFNKHNNIPKCSDDLNYDVIGLELINSQEWIIRNNVFENFVTCGNSSTAIYCQYCSDMVLENNLFVNNHHDIRLGVDLNVEYSNDSFSEDFMIRNNIFYKNNSLFLLKDNYTFISIYLGFVNNTKIYGNSFFFRQSNKNTSYPLFVLFNESDVLIYNNLFSYDSNVSDVSFNMDKRYNLFYDAFSWFIGIPYNIRFIYNVSQLVDKGKYLDEMLIYDYYGNARIGLPDIGAIEYKQNICSSSDIFAYPLNGTTPFTVYFNTSCICDNLTIYADLNNDGVFDLIGNSNFLNYTYFKAGVYNVKIVLYCKGYNLGEKIFVINVVNNTESYYDGAITKNSFDYNNDVIIGADDKYNLSFNETGHNFSEAENDYNLGVLYSLFVRNSKLYPYPKSGVVPLKVIFRIESKGDFLDKLLSFFTKNLIFITYYWDFEGDGKVDLTTHIPVAQFIYEKPGEYYPVVRIIYKNISYSLSTQVNVLSPSMSHSDDVYFAFVNDSNSYDHSGFFDKYFVSLLNESSYQNTFYFAKNYFVQSLNKTHSFLLFIFFTILLVGVIWWRNHIGFPLPIENISIYKYYNYGQEIYDFNKDEKMIKKYLQYLKRYREYYRSYGHDSLDDLLKNSKYLLIYFKDGRKAYVILSNKVNKLYDDAIILFNGKEEWWLCNRGI